MKWKLGIVFTVFLAGCDPSGSEPGKVELPVMTAHDGVTACTNNLGWEVTLKEARVAVRDLEFTIKGETHVIKPVSNRYAFIDRVRDLFLAKAIAHPGHQAGGEVTGQMLGDFIADFINEKELGIGTLLSGEYHGMNLRFRRAGVEDGLTADDPLLGHTAFLAGEATREGTKISFEAILDIEDGLQMVGGPFVLSVNADTVAMLGLTLYTIDPSEHDTLFDDLDFGALDDDKDGRVVIKAGDVAHNILSKTFVRHDQWGIVVREKK